MDRVHLVDGPGFRRVWPVFATWFTITWILTALTLAMNASWNIWHFIPESWWHPLNLLLFWVFPVFVLNLYLKFRWSGLQPRAFARKHWVDILMVIPALRGMAFIRIFNVGRVGFVVRWMSMTRRSFSVYRKGRKSKQALADRKRKAAAAQVAGSSGGPPPVEGPALRSERFRSP